MLANQFRGSVSVSTCAMSAQKRSASADADAEDASLGVRSRLAAELAVSGCAGSGAGSGQPTATVPLPTSTSTVEATVTPAPSATQTVAPSPSATSSPTLTATASATGTPSNTASATITPSATPTLTPRSAPTEIDVLPPAVSAQVDTLIAAFMSAQTIPGMAVAVTQNGATVYAKGYGFAECATAACTAGTPVYANTPFELGSVTKSFTAFGMLLILDNPSLNTSDLGTFTLTAPIKQYLATDPDFTFPDAWDAITTGQLLSMASGLIDDSSCDLTWYEILDQVGQSPLPFPPGTNFCYSDPSFMLIGAIIQQLTGTAYDQFMAANVFAPLQMDDTLIHTDGNTPANLATGYIYDSTNMSWSAVSPVPPLSSFSSGALISTAVDLGTFIGALQNRALLQQSTYELMWTLVELQNPPRLGSWGLGWEIRYVDSIGIYRKNGELPGVSAEIALYDLRAADPPVQIGVAMATNETGVTGFVPLAAQIAGAVLGTPIPAPGTGGNGCTPTPCFNCPTPTPTGSG